MALGDALLSTFRTQQIANQQRQANQLAQQRLDVSQQQLGLMEQEEARQAQQFANEEKVRMNDGTFNQMLENGYFDIKTNRFNKEKFRTDIQNGVPAADALALRMAQDKLGMTTPEGFALDKVTRLPNGKFAFGGSYTDGRGVFGEGVLTKDGTSFPDSEIATFENAGDIANAAELYYKTTLLQDSTLGANYPQLAAARELANVDPNLLTVVNAADQAMATGTTEGAEVGRNANAVLSQIQDDPETVAKMAADVLPGSDDEINALTGVSTTSEAPSVSEAPPSVQSGSSVIDTLKQRQPDINDRKLDNLLGAYERNLNAYQTDAPNSEVAAIKQRRLDKAKAELEAYPRQQLEDLETERDVLQSRGEKGGRPASAARGQLRVINAKIQQHKADYNLEDAAPISDSVTDPEQQAVISEAENGANEIPLDSDTAKEDLEAYGQTLLQNPQTASIVAQGMQTAGFNNMDDVNKADLKSKKMIFAFISAMGATDAQKNDAFSSLMNLGETGVESMSAYQAMQLAQGDYANFLSAERNRISELQANQQIGTELRNRMDATVDWLKDNVADEMAAIIDPEGEGKELPSNTEAEEILQRIDTNIVPQIMTKSAAAATPQEAKQYLDALMRTTNTYVGIVALTERGGLFETIKSSVPFWRGQAQPTFSEASLRNIEVVSYDSNGEPVRFKATGVAGDTRSETYSAAQVVGKNPTIGKLFISMIKARDAARAQQSE